MIRNNKHIDYVNLIRESMLFLQNVKEEKTQMQNNIKVYEQIINSNGKVFSKFPALIDEINSNFNIEHFTVANSSNIIETMKSILVKLTYISDIIDDIEEVRNSALETKINLNSYKSAFKNSANRLVFRSIDTLHFEMQNF